MSAAAWAGVAERGSTIGMWITVLAYRVLGRRLSTVLVLGIVSYFFATDRRGRRASRRYLERLHAVEGGAAALGHPPSLRDSFRHYREFGLAVLDRLRFTLGAEDIEIVLRGEECLAALIADKRGAILLGAHLGSFDALRVLAERTGVVVNVMMVTRHAPRINALLRRLNPAADLRVLEAGPGAGDTVFRLKACLERGEFVAILGDRIGGGVRARVVRVPFLGAPAPFPQGPFLLAHALGCPMVLLIALRRSAHRYEVFAEPLAAEVVLPRPERAQRLPEIARRYAERLEAYCLAAPYQWFNFFDFWGEMT